MVENMTVEQVRILQKMIYSKAFQECEVKQITVDISEVKNIVKGATLDDDDYDSDDAFDRNKDPEELFRIVSGKVLEAYTQTFPEKSSFEL